MARGRPTVIYQQAAEGERSPIGVMIEARGPALQMFRTRERNAIVRVALAAGGEYWRREFLPMRFTRYVERAPFSYRANLMVKAVGLGLRDQISEQTGGWDPWSPEWPPPGHPIWRLYWNDVRGGRRHTKTGMKDWVAEFRRDRKRAIRQRLRGMVAAGILTPLVFTGEARSAALGRSRVVSTATANTQQVKIKIPLGDHGHTDSSGKRSYGISPIVSRVIKTVPQWELKRIAQRADQIIGMEIQQAVKTVNRKKNVKARMTITQQDRLGLTRRARAGVNRRAA